MRLACLALSCCVALVFVGGCGDDNEKQGRKDVAASIGERVITETDVDRSIDRLFPHEGGYRASLGPPDYPECVQAKREADGGSATEAKKQCKVEFEIIRAQTLSYLLRAEWAKRESVRLNAPQPHTGSLRQRVDQRLGQLQSEIPVSNAEISQYGEDNGDVYADSERRVVDVVQTRGRARAMRARAELEAGRPWADVIDRYGTRPLRRTYNGHHEVREASAPHDDFGRGMFTARIGVLSGPVKTLNGLFVFRVLRVSHKASGRLSSQVRQTILHTLQSNRLEERLHNRYASQTNCARRYRVPEVPQCM